MDFGARLREGKIRKIRADTLRAKSMFKASLQAIDTAKIIPLTTTTAKTVFRELYEGFREYCEGIGFLHGYKFLDHESITYFLRDILKEQRIALKFDRYRKLRNGINYYGDDIDVETVKEAMKEIPKLRTELEKHTKTL